MCTCSVNWPCAAPCDHGFATCPEVSQFLSLHAGSLPSRPGSICACRAGERRVASVSRAALMTACCCCVRLRFPSHACRLARFRSLQSCRRFPRGWRRRQSCLGRALQRTLRLPFRMSRRGQFLKPVLEDGGRSACRVVGAGVRRSASFVLRVALPAPLFHVLPVRARARSMLVCCPRARRRSSSLFVLRFPAAAAVHSRAS